MLKLHNKNSWLEFIQFPKGQIKRCRLEPALVGDGQYGHHLLCPEENPSPDGQSLTQQELILSSASENRQGLPSSSLEDYFSFPVCTGHLVGGKL